MDKLIQQIFEENERKLRDGNQKEMTDVIYDTLMGCTRYPQFDTEKVTEFERGVTSETDSKNGVIRFGYMGHEYKVSVELVK